MSAAKQLVLAPLRDERGAILADEKLILHGDARAIAVAKFRELADRIESGELDGARCQWREGNPEMQLVTQSATEVQLVTFTIEKV